MTPCRARCAAAVAAGLLLLAGCASDPAPPAAAPGALSGGPLAIADAIPEAQQVAVIAGFDAELKARLAALPLSPAYRLVSSGGSQPSRLILEPDRAFEFGSAQLKPELLLPLADTVEATGLGGAWVVHVIAIAATADEADLAERRSASVLAYLASQGLRGGRLRAETRSGGAASLEVQFVPIIQGREARAWMPPESVAARR
jgi:outer membrane protein OmpA-like peptidoglycan-associated protein